MLFVLVIKNTQKTYAEHITYNSILIFQIEVPLGIKIKVQEEMKMYIPRNEGKKQSRINLCFTDQGKLDPKRLSSIPNVTQVGTAESEQNPRFLMLTLRGEQSLPPQKMSFEDTDYFNLVIFKKQNTQEKSVTSPQLPKRIQMEDLLQEGIYYHRYSLI